MPLGVLHEIEDEEIHREACAADPTIRTVAESPDVNSPDPRRVTVAPPAVAKLRCDAPERVGESKESAEVIDPREPCPAVRTAEWVRPTPAALRQTRVDSDVQFVDSAAVLPRRMEGVVSPAGR